MPLASVIGGQYTGGGPLGVESTRSASNRRSERHFPTNEAIPNAVRSGTVSGRVVAGPPYLFEENNGQRWCTLAVRCDESSSSTTLDPGALARIRTGTPLRKLRNHGHRRGIRSPNGPCTNLAVAVITPAICVMRGGHPTTVITSTIHIEEGQAACDRDG